MEVNVPSALEILEVTQATLDPELFCGAFVGKPAPDDKEQLPVIHFQGWVLGRAQRAVAVEVLSEEGEILRQIRVDQPRPDVPQLHPGVEHAAWCGFIGTVGLLGFPPEFRLSLQAVLENDARAIIATIRGRKRPLRSSYTPRLQPLMVTSFGRSGSTWLMRVLYNHPSIAMYVQEEINYEQRGALYWMHMLKVLAEPANSIQSAHPDTFWINPWWVGHHPRNTPLLNEPWLKEWFGHTYVEKLAEFCAECIDSFYAQVAAQQHHPAARYFAEKFSPNWLPWMLWELYPQAREIILIRDFRDVFCSVTAYNAKTGATAFGRELAQSDEAYIEWLGGAAQGMLDGWRRRASRALLVRYEDLIQKPQETWTTILQYLGLAHEPALIQQLLSQAAVDTPNLVLHRTTDNPAASVGRWRRDLSPALQALCNETFRVPLREFGYEPTAIVPPAAAYTVAPVLTPTPIPPSASQRDEAIEVFKGSIEHLHKYVENSVAQTTQFRAQADLIADQQAQLARQDEKVRWQRQRLQELQAQLDRVMNRPLVRAYRWVTRAGDGKARVTKAK